MNSIDESETLRLHRIRAVVIRIAQQARWHARPECKNDKGDQIAKSHGPSARFIKHRPGASSNAIIAAIHPGHGAPPAGGGEIVEEHKEKNGSGNMNEGVDAVSPSHQGRILEEPLLNWALNEDTQSLL